MVEMHGPLRSFVSAGLRLCRISSTIIVPPIGVEDSIRLKAAPTPFVQNKPYERTGFFTYTYRLMRQRLWNGDPAGSTEADLEGRASQRIKEEAVEVGQVI